MDDLSTTSPTAAPDDEEYLTVRELTKVQRRALGVLVEKGFTTPEYYPLTLKAVTTGCNQKSNRDPVTNYSEDALEDALDELRQMGLVAVVHTESGRTERFRHFMRKRFPFTEPQLAIITELLLRGRQQLGELRSRASRMARIESLEELRENLEQLAAQGFIRSSGPLERRGIDVDHTFYPASEAPDLGMAEASAPAARAETIASAPPPAAANSSTDDVIDELRSEISDLKGQLADLTDEVAELKRSLGV